MYYLSGHEKEATFKDDKRYGTSGVLCERTAAGQGYVQCRKDGTFDTVRTANYKKSACSRAASGSPISAILMSSQRSYADKKRLARVS